MPNLLSQADFGQIKPPVGVSTGDPGQVIGNLVQNIIWFLIVGAGIYSVFNLIMAGYTYIGAGDDSKKVAAAWAQIWQTLLGLAISAGAFVLAAIFGQLLFGNAGFLLKPTITPLK